MAINKPFISSDCYVNGRANDHGESTSSGGLPDGPPGSAGVGGVVEAAKEG